MERKDEKFVFGQELDFEELGGGVKRKILAYGDDLMQVEVHFEKGAVGAMHSHPHTQLTYVLSGAFEFNIDGVTKTVRAGDTLFKLPGIVHGCVCLEKGVLLDTFTPCRKDFLK
ncbi:MAG: cupin domain-containing protein [Clostridia bacterium]|nr:cupin domain-containing protein [Clostridia bacterium]